MYEDYVLRYEPGPVAKIFAWCKSFFRRDQSESYMQAVSQLYHFYLIYYCKSIEFNHVLSIPVDFHVELLLINMHLWLLLDRLKDLDGGVFNISFAQNLTTAFDVYFESQLTKVHMGRKTDVILDTKMYLKRLRTHFDTHFRNNVYTVTNPMHRIDALVWSVVFLEKCDRYDNRVYLISSYLLETREMLKRCTLEDLKEMRITFSPFVVPVDYRQQIEKVNPPLTREQLLADLQEKDPTKKRFRYDYKNPQNTLPKIEEVSS